MASVLLCSEDPDPERAHCPDWCGSVLAWIVSVYSLLVIALLVLYPYNGDGAPSHDG